MSFRRKLLAVFGLTVFLSVTAIAFIVSVVTRRAFERADEERTTALVAQFRREFMRRGDDILRRVQAVASSEATTRMALTLNRAPDSASFLSEARNLADAQQLDFLEFIDSQATIISSAQWPAKFGYKDNSPPNLSAASSEVAFLKQEELPEGPVLGLFAVRSTGLGEKPLYVIGGRRLDKDFLASLELPAGMRALLYQNLSPGFSPQFLLAASGNLQQPDKLTPIIQRVQQRAAEVTETVHWSTDPIDDEGIHAIPLQGADKQLLGVLLIGDSRRPYVELRRHIQSAALLVGGGGILLSILFSAWAAARVTLPVEALANAARDVAAGNLKMQVAVTSSDELGELAESFNRMTRDLLEQRARLVQSERVAAWRELARRLAHELKNPLFPLQLTVENLMRARQQSPEQFEDILQESSSTLLAEIENLKAIISRFSEFSKMPQPQYQQVQLNEVVQGVVRLLQTQFQSSDRVITCNLALDQNLPPIAADPELLHRAISNLVLNAMDAMPQGGALTLRTRQEGSRACLEISDTGSGLTPEECERLFTPYYTTKQHGTGLGLAIVQSVVSDHGGKITVQSAPGQGSTFVVELPRNLAKLRALGQPSSGAIV